MIDPLSVFGAILAVVQMIVMLANKALEKKNQSKHKCLELAQRVKDLAIVLHDFPDSVANDKATEGVQQRLKAALDAAFRLINYCQDGGFLRSCCRKVVELDNIDKTISTCIMDLLFISQHRITGPVPPVPDYYYNNYDNQANGGWPSPQHASSTSHAPPYYQPPCIGWPSSQRADAASTSHAPAPPYYQPPCAAWPSPSPVMFPGSPPYPAYPASRLLICRLLTSFHPSKTSYFSIVLRVPADRALS
jgi:hypothetical protein